MKKLLPESVVKSLNLELTGVTMNDSVIRGCVFYKFTNETSFDLYITNYDIRIDPYEGIDPDLSTHGTWLIFGKKDGWFNSIMVSDEILSDSFAFDHCLSEFIQSYKKSNLLRN